jgi:hypothetical protein
VIVLKKSNTWIKIVIIIIILELIVGTIILAYKKLNNEPDNSISTNDKVVKELYEKVAYNDIESLDVMSSKTMLYYGYKNMDINESTNCDAVNTIDDTTGYSCEGIVDFIPSKEIEKSVKDIYGPDITITPISFELDANHYAFYDEEMDGYAIYTKDEEVSIDPINMKLKNAILDDDDSIILTVEVLDGVFGTVKDTYKFKFIKDSNNYYLTSKEIVTSKEK